MKKRILSIFIAGALLFTVLTMVAYAQTEDFELNQLVTDFFSALFKFLSGSTKTSYKDLSNLGIQQAPLVSITYYVDNNNPAPGDGSITNPFNTIQQGLNVAVAGDTVMIRGDTSGAGRVYTETPSFPNSGANGAPITLQNYPGEKVLIRDVGTINLNDFINIKGNIIFDRNFRTGTYIMDILDDDNVFLQDIDLRNAGLVNSPAAGIHIKNSENITMINISIHDIYESGNGSSGFTHCITANRGTVQTRPIRNFKIINSTLFNCAGDGIQFFNNQAELLDPRLTSDTILIEGNLFYTTLGDRAENGIDMKEGNNIIVRNNTYHGFKSQPCGGAQTVIFSKSHVNVTVEGNLIYDSYIGIDLHTEDSPIPGIDNVTIRHNIIRDMPYCGFGRGMIEVNSENGDPLTNIFIYHNTIVNGGNNQIWGSGPGSVTVRNNLFYNCGSAATISGYTITASNNGWFGGNCSTGGTLNGPNDVINRTATEDPQFVNLAGKDFHLQATSPVIDRGFNLGESFYGTAPDLGNFEFIPTAAVPPTQIHLSTQTGDPSNEMTVTWKTASTAESNLRLGTSSGSYTTTANGVEYSPVMGAGASVSAVCCFHAAQSINLLPNTTYYYQVGGAVSGWSQEYSFKTAPLRGSQQPFTFVAYGDQGNDIDDPDSVLVANRADSDNPSFVIHMGDLSYCDTQACVDSYFNNVINNLATGAYYMASIGNHEFINPDNLFTFIGRFDYPYAPLGSFCPASGCALSTLNERWYSFNWGNTHFVAMDLGSSPGAFNLDTNPNDPRLVWLRNDLQAARNDTQINWIIAYMHYPMYANGRDASHSSDIDDRTALEPIFTANRVDLVFSGHQHSYERTLPVASAGTLIDTASCGNSPWDVCVEPLYPIYIMNGAGGRSLYTIPSTFPSWSIVRNNTLFGYNRVTINGNQLRASFIDRNGIMRDDVTIIKSAVNDTQAPIMSNLNPQGTLFPSTTTSVTMSLNTNEFASCKYSAQPNILYGNMPNVFANTNSTTHSTIVSGLVPNNYTYYVRCQDRANNSNTADALIYFTILEPDFTPPVISNVQVTPFSTTALITWTTNEASNSTVNYGTSVALGLIATNSSMSTSHTVRLAGLAQSTAYFFEVLSADASNNIARDDNNGSKYSFTTLSSPYIYLEAEDGILNTNMQIGTDLSASNGAYIFPRSGIPLKGTPAAEANYTVNIPQTGDYRLWLRMYGPTFDNDALYIGFDGNFDRVFPTATNVYQWVGVEVPSLPPGNYVHNLNAGNHAIYIGYTDELLARADCMLVTNDLAFIPTGNCTVVSDTTPPLISNIQNTSIAIDSAVITWDTNEISSTLVKYGTSSGFYTLQATGVSGTSHYVNLSGLSSLIQYFYVVNSTDGSGNSAQSTEHSFRTLAAPIPDTSPPSYSNIRQPVQPINYTKLGSYQFNITWQDNTQVNTVWIEHNFNNGVFRNVTVTTRNGNEYYFNIQDLAAGSYLYRWHANDTSNNKNQTLLQTFAISKYTPTCSLTFLPLGSVRYPNPINATGSCLPNETSYNLHRDNGGDLRYKVINDENGRFVVLGVGFYTYIVNITSTENYTFAQLVRPAVVVPALNPVTLLLNGIAGNITILSTQTLNATGGSASGVFTMSRDGIDVTSQSGLNVNLPTGIHNYTVLDLVGSQNYTFNDTGITFSVNVTTVFVDNQAPTYSNILNPSTTVYLKNGSYYFNVTWIDNSALDTVVIDHNFNNGVFRNVTVTTRVGSQYYFRTNDLGTGTYLYRWYANDTSNNKNQTLLQTFVLNRGTPSCTLNALPSSTVQYPTNINVSGLCSPGETPYNLYRNNVLANNENGRFLQLRAGTHNYVVNISATPNYTASAGLLTVNVLRGSNSVRLLLNGVSSDITIASNQSINATVYTDSGNFNLFGDGIDITSLSGLDVNLPVGVYQFMANTTGNENYTSNNTGPVFTATVIPATCTIDCNFTLTLSRGINFVSVPLSIGNNNIDTLLQPILSNIRSIYYYDTSSISWKVYHSNPLIPDSLTVINQKTSYFIVMNNSAAITFRGNVTTVVRNLTSGWNSIGIINLSSIRIRDELRNVNFTSVWKLNASNRYEEITDYNTNFEPSKGYWVYIP